MKRIMLHYLNLVQHVHADKENFWSNVTPPSLLSSLKTPRGVAFHSFYFAICDVDNQQLLFFNVATRKLIYSIKPTLPPSSTTSIFTSLWGLCIDGDSDIIAVSYIRSNSIVFFKHSNYLYNNEANILK